MSNFQTLPPEDQERIMDALDRLCAGNPDVVIQLEKLAEIKEGNPVVWGILKSKCK